MAIILSVLGIACIAYIVYVKCEEEKREDRYSWAKEIPDIWETGRKMQSPTIRLGYEDDYVLVRVRTRAETFRDERGRLHRPLDGNSRLKVVLNGVLDKEPGKYHVILRKENIEFDGYLTEDLGTIVEC